MCERIWFESIWQRGCGYIRVSYWGDVGDEAADIWNETTGELVYHWFNGMMSSGCAPESHAGEEPECDDWVDACGGAGGAAGSAND